MRIILTMISSLIPQRTEVSAHFHAGVETFFGRVLMFYPIDPVKFV